MRFIALSSSRGTTLEAILQSMKDGTLQAECMGLVTDKADRGCVEKAKKFGVPVTVVARVPGESKEMYDHRLHDTLMHRFSPKRKNDDLIATVGWMYILTPWFVRQWHNRILNVHPSLLPKYPGIHAHEEVIAAKEKETGMTIHLIDEGIDTGPTLLQQRCPVLPEDTPETLKTRVQEMEKIWYPRVLQMIAVGEMKLP